MAETSLPDPTDLARLIGELRERLRQAPDPPGAGPPSEPAPPEEALVERQLDDGEALELEAVGRRRLLEALLHGSARPWPSGRGLWWGLAVAVALALGIGLAGMVGGTLARGGPGRAASTAIVVRF